MRLKTEEVEILKVELKDVKEILKLKEEIKEKGLDGPHNENPWKNKLKSQLLSTQAQHCLILDSTELG